MGAKPRTFRDFVWGTSIVGMGVGMAMGMAVMGVVSLFVKDILLPLFSALAHCGEIGNLFFVVREGSTPGPYMNAEHATKSGAMIVQYGMVVVAIVCFAFVSLTMYLILRRAYSVQQEIAAKS